MGSVVRLSSAPSVVVERKMHLARISCLTYPSRFAYSLVTLMDGPSAPTNGKGTRMLKIEATKIKNIKGRITGYRVQAAGISVEAATEKEACELWHERANLQEQEYRNRYDFTPDGSLFHLYYRDGWRYDIARPENPGRWSTCLLSAPTYPQALSQYIDHLRQCGAQLAA
jgi:hypothetical protein